MTDASTPASVVAALAGLSRDEITAALEAANQRPEVLTAIEAALVAAAEAKHKRQLMAEAALAAAAEAERKRLAAAAEAEHKRRLVALDVRNDALGRTNTMRTLIEVIGLRTGNVVCRRWHEASRGLALSEEEARGLALCIARDHTNRHLLANLRHYDIRQLDLCDFQLRAGDFYYLQYFDPDAQLADAANATIAAFAKSCGPKLISVNLTYRGFRHGPDDRSPYNDTSLMTLANGCRNLASINLTGNKHFTEAGFVALAKGCRNLTSVDLSLIGDVSTCAVVALALNCGHLTTVDLGFCKTLTDEGSKLRCVALGLLLWGSFELLMASTKYHY